jgi:hypothetical protein
MAWRYVATVILLADLSAAWAWNTPDGLYFTGAGADALVADGTVRVDGSRFACAGCHGADGRGDGEGATAIPPVTWEALTAPTGGRPAYDAALVARAVRSGIGPDGTALSASMPRYEMDDAAMAGLVESLKHLEGHDRKAFGPREVRIRAGLEDPRRHGFADAVQAFNAAGGAYGRNIAVVEEGDALMLNDIADLALSGAAELAEAMLFDQIATDGHRRIRWLTALPPAERDFRLRQRGLLHDDTAPVLLWTGPGVAPTAWQAVDAVYADLAVAAPVLGSLIERSVPLFLAAPDADLLDAALRDPAPLAYVEGYLAGLALGQALTDTGRAAGQEALRRALAGAGPTLPISVHRIGE